MTYIIPNFPFDPFGELQKRKDRYKIEPMEFKWVRTTWPTESVEHSAEDLRKISDLSIDKEHKKEFDMLMLAMSAAAKRGKTSYTHPGDISEHNRNKLFNLGYTIAPQIADETTVTINW